jgi:hypothetical protein
MDMMQNVTFSQVMGGVIAIILIILLFTSPGLAIFLMFVVGIGAAVMNPGLFATYSPGYSRGPYPMYGPQPQPMMMQPQPMMMQPQPMMAELPPPSMYQAPSLY